MAPEADPEHVPHLALVPVCRRPDIGDGFDRRIFPRERHFDTHVIVALEGEQVIDDSEVAREPVAAIGSDALVNSRQIIEEPIRPLRFRLEISQHLARFIPGRPQRGYPVTPVAYGLWPDGRFAE